MASLSFDPAADFYDVSRGYPVNIARKIAQALDIEARATPETAFLEIGVGTGRIAFPIASLGRNYTGVDISTKMLEKLVEKLQLAGWREHGPQWGSLADEIAAREIVARRFVHDEPKGVFRLVASNISQLPFVDASFDVVVAVHIFHLVDEWEQALQEVARVLRPGGKLLRCWDTYDSEAVNHTLIRKWRTIVTELGGAAGRPGASERTIQQWLLEHNYRTENLHVLTWEQSVIPRQALEHIAQRYWSSSWQLTDDLFNASIERLRTWATAYYGEDMDKEQMQRRHFYVSSTCF